MLTLFGYICAIFVGLTLGLFGAGGSMLTVPILVHFFGISPADATGDSLLVVATISLSGAITYMRRKQMHVQKGLLFAAPAVVGVVTVRRIIMPSLPETIAHIGSFTLSKDSLIMTTFALVALTAAIRMIAPPRQVSTTKPNKTPTITRSLQTHTRLALQGISIGAICGFVGAGGGFLFIPALVLLARLPMQEAVGTSLLVITLNAGCGFLADMLAGRTVLWQIIIPFILCGSCGMGIGLKLSKHFPSQHLKPTFGIFMLLVSLLILGNEVF